MQALLLVMLGGSIGAGARHLVGRALTATLGTAWPWATLTVNVVGGLLMGLLAGTLARSTAGEPWRLLLGVGLLGGFTTFSAFSLEAATMIQRGAGRAALGYALMSMTGSVAALFLGLVTVRGLT